MCFKVMQEKPSVSCFVGMKNSDQAERADT